MKTAGILMFHFWSLPSGWGMPGLEFLIFLCFLGLANCACALLWDLKEHRPEAE